MKTPIKYFGGKTSMFATIQSNFPADDEYHMYIEPYGGSAAMLLSRPLVGHVEIYNDIYENVYALFKCLSDATLFAEFKAKCDLVIYSEQLRAEYREKLKEGKNLSMVERAYYFWYVNRTSHNGIGGWSMNCCVRRKMCKATSDFLSCIDRMPELHDRLSAVVIEHRDALEVMQKYNAANVFVYLDPPYTWDTRGTHRYACDYTPEQHKQLIDFLLVAKFKWLLSGYANPEYKRLENHGFVRTDFTVNTITGAYEKSKK